jgi:hypothetical protein
MKFEIRKSTVLKLLFIGAVGALIHDRVKKSKATKDKFEKHKKKVLSKDNIVDDILEVSARNDELSTEQCIIAAKYLQNKHMQLHTAHNIETFDKAYCDLYAMIYRIKNCSKAEATVTIALWEDEMERAEKQQAELERRRSELEKLETIASAIRSLSKVPRCDGITINLRKEN